MKMRNTRENVIKLTEILIEVSERNARNKEYDKTVRDFERHTAMGMKSILWLLTDKEFLKACGKFGVMKSNKPKQGESPVRV